eukprot:759696-Hanusia_phi.AAC.5
MAVSACSIGAPEAQELPYAQFENTRNYRPCHVQSFIDAAEKCGDTNSALQLAELQMWWEPSWSHLQALQTLSSPQKFSLRQQQLQSLALNDSRFKPEVRFEVLVREGLHPRAATMLSSVANEDMNVAVHAAKVQTKLNSNRLLTVWIEWSRSARAGRHKAAEWHFRCYLALVRAGRRCELMSGLSDDEYEACNQRGSGGSCDGGLFRTWNSYLAWKLTVM